MPPWPQSTENYSLSAFQSCIKQVDEANLFIPYKSATARVMALKHCNARVAREYIRALVLMLQPDNFSKPATMKSGAAADEYGIAFDGITWYIKLMADPPGPLTSANAWTISCHDAERDVHTRGGLLKC